jgi:hypothetical protein
LVLRRREDDNDKVEVMKDVKNKRHFDRASSVFQKEALFILSFSPLECKPPKKGLTSSVRFFLHASLSRPTRQFVLSARVIARVKQRWDEFITSQSKCD